MYHKVARCPSGAKVPFHYVSPARFASQMQWLKRLGWQGVTVEHMRRAIVEGIPRKLIGLSFDDGYANFDSAAAPILEAHGFRGTVFVVTGQIGGANIWDSSVGEVEEALLGKDQLLKLRTREHEVGSHTVNHVKLAEVSEEVARLEVCRSKVMLEEILQQDVKSFCYPYGSLNGAAQELVKQAGYLSACSTRKGWNDETTDCTRWRRINIRKDTSTPLLFWKIEVARRKYPRID